MRPDSEDQTAVKATSFPAFFTACWGNDKPPFAWQTALAHRVIGVRSSAGSKGPEPERVTVGQGASGWPEVIALPTASGKTACLDIAVFALAVQADNLRANQRITAPRRIFFVVDRRVIVDEAYERARRLANKLETAQNGILKTVADNLRRISHGTDTGFEGERPLSVHVLRGGMYRSEAWARNPLQPAIVASTVDQVGSRLLFRAYGRGSGTWPIYAGLVANDSLILLDEAHCAQPFLQTLQAVDRFRGHRWAEAPLKRPFHAVVMSATPPKGLGDVFEDQSGEPHSIGHPLGRRQLASKPADLKRVTAAKGSRVTEAFSKALASAALRLLGEDRKAIAVFVNRVATARETYRRLRQSDGITAILLTGRMRPVDKDAVLQRLKDLRLGSNHSCKRNLENPVVVVATQTLEVGADLDFDGLVTECASLDALRQRFGRLNRMGRDIPSRGSILIRGDQERLKKRDTGDPIYGEALSRTWDWLNQHKDEDGDVDFAIATLDRLVRDDDTSAELVAPSPDAPVMLPTHVDCWAQTAPAPEPTPDVGRFLRGGREFAPDVQVCWRADLDLRSEELRRAALESLALCPPSSAETLPVPVGVMRRWLSGDDATDQTGDVEGIGDPVTVDQSDDSPVVSRLVVRWRDSKTTLAHITSKQFAVQPGDVIVIPTAHGGPWNQLGDLPEEATETPAALDVGDRAHRLARAKPILRLHPDLVATWPDELPGSRAASVLLEDVKRKYDEDPDQVVGAVRDLLIEMTTGSVPLPHHSRWSWLTQAAQELTAEFSNNVTRLRRDCRVVGDRTVILVGRRHLPQLVHAADTFSDEDDSTASGTSHRDGRAVGLVEHLHGVERFARKHGKGCGLPVDLTDALARAGLIHDIGKADPRFQALLRGGSRWHAGTPLAKSAHMPHSPAARRRAREAIGYPVGGPHPLVSVRLIESVPEHLPTHPDMRDLVLHLVASHHGQCRPFAPVVPDSEPVEVSVSFNGTIARCMSATTLERLDSGVSDRYWRLTRRYGWWGLAWLEALLRLADWRQSAWEQTTDG